LGSPLQTKISNLKFITKRTQQSKTYRYNPLELRISQGSRKSIALLKKQGNCSFLVRWSFSPRTRFRSKIEKTRTKETTQNHLNRPLLHIYVVGREMLSDNVHVTVDRREWHRAYVVEWHVACVNVHAQRQRVFLTETASVVVRLVTSAIEYGSFGVPAQHISDLCHTEHY
jgi:hypothetical protein